MKTNIKKIFILMMSYVKNDNEIDPENWLLMNFLDTTEVMPAFKNNITSATMDPAYWYDWKELVEEELSKDKSILDENNGLTLEQSLVAIRYFLQNKYWVKNNDMLLKDAYADLVNEYNANKNNLESSQLWQEWLVAVAEGKKFDKIFKVDPSVFKYLYNIFYSDKYSSERRMSALLEFMRLAEEDITNTEVAEICELREIKDSKLFLEAMNSRFSDKISNIMKKICF